MKGDEFAEDLELPRRIDENEDDEAASGPSLTPSGPMLDLPLEDIPHSPGYWLRPNDDEELVPRFFTPYPTLTPEELVKGLEIAINYFKIGSRSRAWKSPLITSRLVFGQGLGNRHWSRLDPGGGAGLGGRAARPYAL